MPGLPCAAGRRARGLSAEALSRAAWAFARLAHVPDALAEQALRRREELELRHVAVGERSENGQKTWVFEGFWPISGVLGRVSVP